MELYTNPDIKAIIFLEGGDFACDILEYLDFNEISNLEPKWIMGYSDCTTLVLTLTTICDIATIYGPNFKSFGMKNLHTSLLNSLRLMKNEEFIQSSYEKCEKLQPFDEKNEDNNPYYEFNLTENVKWINLKNEDEIQVKGRCLGGCIDILREDIIGSQFDKLKDYCEKYKEDGII